MGGRSPSSTKTSRKDLAQKYSKKMSKLFREVAITPQLPKNCNERNLKSILLDVLRGGFIASYQGREWNKIFARCASRKSMSALSRLETNKKIVHNKHQVDFEEKREWPEKVLKVERNTDKRIHLVVANKEISNEYEEEKVRCPENTYSEDYWKVILESSSKVEMSIDEYQKELNNILGCTKKARIIDPYFPIEKLEEEEEEEEENENRKFVHKLIKSTSKYLEKNVDTEVNIKTSTKYMDKEVLEGSKNNIQKYPVKRKMNESIKYIKEIYEKLEKEKPLKVNIWILDADKSKKYKKYDRIHDRFIVTDQVAVTIPWGFNMPDDERPPKTDWALLNNHRRDELKNRFPRTCDEYKNIEEDMGVDDAGEISQGLHRLHSYAQVSLNPDSSHSETYRVRLFE